MAVLQNLDDPGIDSGTLTFEPSNSSQDIPDGSFFFKYIQIHFKYTETTNGRILFLLTSDDLAVEVKTADIESHQIEHWKPVLKKDVSFNTPLTS